MLRNCKTKLWGESPKMSPLRPPGALVVSERPPPTMKLTGLASLPMALAVLEVAVGALSARSAAASRTAEYLQAQRHSSSQAMRQSEGVAATVVRPVPDSEVLPDQGLRPPLGAKEALRLAAAVGRPEREPTVPAEDLLISPAQRLRSRLTSILTLPYRVLSRAIWPRVALAAMAIKAASAPAVTVERGMERQASAESGTSAWGEAAVLAATQVARTAARSSMPVPPHLSELP